MKIGPLSLSVLLLTGCGKKDDTASEATYVRGDCDPIDPSICAFPYPSDFYLTEANTETGGQVSFGPTTMPANRDGVPFDPKFWNEKDGFSVSAPLITWFEDVSLEGTVPFTDQGAWADPASKTVILDTVTGERIPHFVEQDAIIDEAWQRVLYLRPLVILEYNRRYVVGIRGLQKKQGGPVDVSKGFAALRDGTAHDEVSKARQAHFDADVFPVLEADGFARDELQLAWDFTTMSRQNSVGRMEWMRDDMIARVGASGPAYTIDDIEDRDCTSQDIARVITGTMTVPMYTEEDASGTILTRDENDQPFYNGDTHPDFTLQIPCSVVADPRPAPVIQLGHGFFGNKSEAKSGFLRQLAEDNGWLILATDWTGMSDEDMDRVTFMFAEDASRFAEVPERSMQGFVEALAASQLMKGDFRTDDAVMFPDANSAPVSVIDPDTRYFYGISMGGILGGAYVGMSPDIERAVLSVSGTPFSMLTNRSVNFIPFFLLLRNKYEDGRHISAMAPLAQMLWDPGESAGWVHDLNRDVPAGMPTKHVLIQTAFHDAQVTTLGGQLQARSYGASLVEPAFRPVFGLEEKTAPFQGSALVEWHYTDVGDEPTEGVPAGVDRNTHNCPRNEPLGMEQVAAFLNTGMVEQPCDGVCEATFADCE